ncbi:MAG: carboxynorspermidine decarboxylase [Cyclobacteriaceae bacterium]
MRSTYSIPSPCFVLNEQRLIDNLQLIEHVQKEAGVDIILAYKGFSMWSAFPIVQKFVSGATASSLNEVLLCNEKMHTKAHTYCVAYDPDEFPEIVAKSSHITFNSVGQYERYCPVVPSTVSMGLRVNPGWSDVETDLYNPSSPASRLGIGHEELTTLPENIEGLHFHVLCESDSGSLEKVLEEFARRFGHLLDKVKWVNMGGGHLMTRKGYDTDHLIRVLKKFKSDYQVDVILEPGSAFAWETGELVTTVLDIVKNGGVNTAIIDASFTCHMPDCLEMPYRPAIEGAFSEPQQSMNSYRIGGVSCLAGDYLDEYWFENPLEAGDRLVFKDMIHYTMVKTSMFNGVKHPSIGLLKENKEFELVRSFTYEDYRDRLS